MSQIEVRPPETRAEPLGELDSAVLRDDHVTVIRPATSWPKVNFRELWRYKELLGVFAWRDLKVRYKQTVIGAAWAIFQPLFTALVFTFIFGRFAKLPSNGLPYPIFAFAGVLAWQYFASAFNTASSSVVSNVPLVTKVYFPRLLLPIGAVLVPLADFVMALPVLIGMMFWFHIAPHPRIVLAPLFILLALVAALGGGLILSAVNVRFRDVPYVIPLFMQILPLVSGVIYAVNFLPSKWQWVLAINPLTAVVSGWRWTVLNDISPVLGQALLGAGVSVLLLVVGLAFFRRSEPRFADQI